MKLARLEIWLILTLVGLMSCGVPGVPKPPSLNLPQPVSDLRAIRKGTRVYLSWTAPTETTDSLPIHFALSTTVCRDPGKMWPGCAGGTLLSVPSSQSVQNDSRRTFVDTLSASLINTDPSAEVFYAISVWNQNNRTAGLSNVVSVPAVVAPPPPDDFRAEVKAEGVEFDWVEVAHGSETPQMHHLYRVYRREEGSTADTLVGELPLDSSPTAELIDHNFDWEKTYFYRVTVVTVIHPEGKPETQFEGEDTAPLKVFVHDVFPPAVPTGLQAVFSGVGQQSFVDLGWAPDTDADLAGYNIYRREAGGTEQKINAQIVKAPAFRDVNVVSGHMYFYSVSAVDVRGNESAHSAETSESVP